MDLRLKAALAIALLAGVPVARGEGRPGYGGTAVAPLGSKVVTIDPGEATRAGELELVSLVFDPLFSLDGADGAGRPQPRVALALTTLDPTHARIALRPGLKFQDGHPVVASDVASSLMRASRLPAGWPLAPIRSARAVDAETVELELVRPAPDLALLLAYPASSVTPEGRAPLQKVIGTGPFRFAGWDSRQILLAANPLCGGGRPYLDTLELRYFGSRAEEAGAYEVGSAQVSLHGASAFEGGAPKHKSAVLDGPRALTTALAFGRGVAAVGAPAALSPALRPLIAGAIDRERLRRAAVREPAVAAAGLAPGVVRAAPDRARARAELARSTAGGRLHLSLIYEASRFGDRDVADKLLAELADVGVDLSVEPTEARLFADRIAAGRYDLALVEAGGVPGPAPPLEVDPARQAMAALALLAAIDPGAARALLARAPADSSTVETAAEGRLWPLFHRAARAHRRADLLGLSIDGLGRLGWADAFFARSTP